VVCGACGSKDASRGSNPSQEAKMTQRRPINEVLANHDQEILAIPGVTMIYAGVDTEGEACIKVGVVTATPEVEERIPKVLEGWTVEVEETGEIKPMH
jgi:hypothetical protein